MFLYIYIILFLFIIFYTIFFGKKINFLLIYLLSSFFYHFPTLFGKYYIYYDNSFANVSQKTYIVLIINCLIIFILYLLSNKHTDTKIYDKSVSTSEIKFIKFIAVINYFLLMYYFFLYKNIIFRDVFDKLYIMSNMSKYLTYYLYFTTFWSVYVFTAKTKLPKYVYLSSILSLLFTFLLGNRSFIVIAFLAIMFAYIHDHLKNASFISFIKQHKKLCFGLLTVILFMFFIKHIYAALFSGNFEVVKNNLLDVDYYLYSIRNSEQNGITRNLDLIVSSNYEYDSISYLENILLLIPGLNHVVDIGPGYSEQSSTYLYGPNANNGSSFLGEAYANGRYLMVIIVVIILSWILSLVYSLLLKMKSGLVKSFFLTIGIDLSFYIARNSSNFAIARTRYYLYSLIILLIIMKLFVKKNHSHEVNDNGQD